LASACALHLPTIEVQVFYVGWGSKSKVWNVPWYDRVECSELSLRFKEPKEMSVESSAKLEF